MAPSTRAARMSAAVITLHGNRSAHVNRSALCYWLDADRKCRTGETAAPRLGGGGFAQPRGPAAEVHRVARTGRGPRTAAIDCGGERLARRERAGGRGVPDRPAHPAAQELRADQSDESGLASGGRRIRAIPPRG